MGHIARKGLKCISYGEQILKYLRESLNSKSGPFLRCTTRYCTWKLLESREDREVKGAHWASGNVNISADFGCIRNTRPTICFSQWILWRCTRKARRSEQRIFVWQLWSCCRWILGPNWSCTWPTRCSPSPGPFHPRWEVVDWSVGGCRRESCSGSSCRHEATSSCPFWAKAWWGSLPVWVLSHRHHETRRSLWGFRPGTTEPTWVETPKIS